jgi:hypothetical protein
LYGYAYSPLESDRAYHQSPFCQPRLAAADAITLTWKTVSLTRVRLSAGPVQGVLQVGQSVAEVFVREQTRDIGEVRQGRLVCMG